MGATGLLYTRCSLLLLLLLLLSFPLSYLLFSLSSFSRFCGFFTLSISIFLFRISSRSCLSCLSLLGWAGLGWAGALHRRLLPDRTGLTGYTLMDGSEGRAKERKHGDARLRLQMGLAWNGMEWHFSLCVSVRFS